jgi:hypothetical protein
LSVHSDAPGALLVAASGRVTRSKRYEDFFSIQAEKKVSANCAWAAKFQG